MEMKKKIKNRKAKGHDNQQICEELKLTLDDLDKYWP